MYEIPRTGDEEPIGLFSLTKRERSGKVAFSSMMKASTILLLYISLLSVVQASYFSDRTYQTVGSKYVVAPGAQEFAWRGIENATQIVEFNEYAYETHDYYDQDDDAFYDVNLGFDFSYYGNVYSRIHITSNGIIAFLVEESKDAPRDVHSRYANVDFGNSKNPLKAVIAPFWDDLYLGEGSFYYEMTGEDGNHEFIITWENIHAIGASGENGITFQVVLQEASGDILFNYRDVEMGSEVHDYGSSATVGMTNDDFSAYTLYSFNESSLENNLSLRFSYEPNITYPRLVSPTNGSHLTGNSLEVAWDYGGQLPVQTFIYLGTEPGLGDIAANVIKNYRSYRKKFLFKVIPNTRDKLYLTLVAECKDLSNGDGNASIQFTDSVEILTEVDPSNCFVFGKCSEGGKPLSGVLDSNWSKNVQLWKVENNEVVFIDSRNLDLEGNYCFTGIEEGIYQISVFNSRSEQKISPEMEVFHGQNELNLNIPKPFDVYSPDNPGMLFSSSPSFKWYVEAGAESMYWILKDMEETEILRHSVDFDRAGSVVFKPNYTFDIQKQYLWDLIAYDEFGNVVQESRNMRFAFVGGETPFFVFPLPGESFPYSGSVNLVYYDGSEQRDIWTKIELSLQEDGEPFYVKDSSGAFMPTFYWNTEISYETIYAKVSFGINGDSSISTYYHTGRKPHEGIKLLSPGSSEYLKKNNQEFRFLMSTEVPESGLSNIIEDIDIVSSNGVEFNSEKAASWSSLGDTQDFQLNVGVLPASNEDLSIRLRYSDRFGGNQVAFFPFKAYPGGDSGYGDYQIDDTILYDWIDGTRGVRLDIKGHKDHRTIDIVLPFSFRFYNQNYEMLRVTDQGFVSFTSDNETGTLAAGESFPDQRTPNCYIAPYRSSLDLFYGGGVFVRTTGEEPHRKFVVQWNMIGKRYYKVSRDEDSKSITFQVILHEGTNEITFQYKDTVFDEEDLENNFGKGAFVGLENQDGSKATVFGEREAVLSDGLAIRFTP